MGEHRIKWGRKNFLYFNYADKYSILDETANKTNTLLEALWVLCARIGLEIDVKKTKSQRLEISEYEKALGDEKIDQVNNFT